LDELELRIRKAEKLVQDAKKEFTKGAAAQHTMFHAAKDTLLSSGKSCFGGAEKSLD